ncbi:MAG TPA: PAC2 family protein [Gaiellales bacterium]|jgi:predicted ATP-grasp superfamily ATP-dependent carboligase
MDFVQLEADPDLRSPRMVAAFKGWNDAGGAASLAAGYLRSVTDAERFAVIDSEPFIDYQQTRPTVHMVDGDVRRVEWPVTEVFASSEHDLLIVLGTEPNMRWRSFSDAIVEVARRYRSQLVITMGALLADTPHTRPVPVSASASDPELMTRHDLARSTYEGPTGIVGVLHDSCSRAGLVSASLWAATPHYISAAPNPQAALALLERLSDLAGTPPGSAELQRAASEYQLRVASAIADDPDVAGYVEQLEQAADRDDPPTGDELAADFERYLREQTDDGEE